jgi:PEGA domain-containing protein
MWPAMADKPQKTQLLTDAPPEVQAAIDRQNQKGGAPQQGQSTVMLDAPNVQAAAPQKQPVVPTMMQQRPSGSLPPVARKKSGGAGRWIAGPLISVAVAAGTAALAGVVMPAKAKTVTPPPKVTGKLQLVTDPPGASVTIDGKPFPHFTPTDVEADVGSTLRIGLKLDGYTSKEEEVAVTSGEHAMNFKLEKAAPPAPVTPPVAPVAPVAAHHDHHDHHATPKEEAGKGKINVFVRPWAIVYVDGARLRQTPVQNYELPSGKHVVELVNDPKGKREKLNITLKAGELQEIRKEWDK